MLWKFVEISITYYGKFSRRPRTDRDAHVLEAGGNDSGIDDDVGFGAGTSTSVEPGAAPYRDLRPRKQEKTRNLSVAGPCRYGTPR